jgi:hypothetical protein
MSPNLFFGPLHFRHTAFDTILVDRALGEKRFVMTKPSMLASLFVVQGG